MNENETKTIAKLDKNTAEEIRFSVGRDDKKYILELLDEFIKILQKINAGEAFEEEKPETAEEQGPGEKEDETDIPF